MNSKINSNLSSAELELAKKAASTLQGGAGLIDCIKDIPEGAKRILDFGCSQGDTLMQLKKERGCTELYGVDINGACKEILAERLDGSWIVDLGKDDGALGEEYENFFNYILLFDVIEHLYDPWYVLPKLRRYLAPEGRMILVVPNFRFWELWYPIILGSFPYGRGGLMNEEHIRWFTWDTLKELITLSGLTLESGHLLFPVNMNRKMMVERLKEPIAELELPPPEVAMSLQKTRVSFPGVTSINSQYPYFMANKLIAICQKGEDPGPPVHIAVGEMAERRKNCRSH